MNKDEIEVFPLKKDETDYRLLTNEYVSISEFEGNEILKVDVEGLKIAVRNSLFRHKPPFATCSFKAISFNT